MMLTQNKVSVPTNKAETAKDARGTKSKFIQYRIASYIKDLINFPFRQNS